MIFDDRISILLDAGGFPLFVVDLGIKLEMFIGFTFNYIGVDRYPSRYLSYCLV